MTLFLSAVGCGCLPTLVDFLLFFRVVWVVWGPPDAFFLLFQFADFVLGSKFGFFTKILQDTGLGCNLKGTVLETICTLFFRAWWRGRSTYSFFVGSLRATSDR